MSGLAVAERQSDFCEQCRRLLAAVMGVGFRWEWRQVAALRLGQLAVHDECSEIYTPSTNKEYDIK